MSSSQGRPLRLLLPVVEPSQRQIPPEEARAKKRPRQTACVPCRDRKTKCDNDRPICQECIRKATHCRYPELDNGMSRQDLQDQVTNLRRRLSTFEQFHDLMRTMPENYGCTMVHRVRAGADIDLLCKNFSEADLLLQLSMVPETRRRYDFPFSKHMPPDLLFEGNQYLDSWVYETTYNQYQYSLSFPSRSRAAEEVQWDEPIPSPPDVYEKPFRAATLADPMLERIDVSRWTTVMSSNMLLRKYLGAYFLKPSVLSPVFDKDTFLESMLHGDTRFASRLLVNAVLATGCQCCVDLEGRWRLWDYKNDACMFLSECRRLWELEPPDQSRLTTVQAALVLGAIYNLNANDFIAVRYMDQACEMAKALSLFRPDHYSVSDKSYRARVTTAWALWSRQALTCLTYSRPFEIERPPMISLPDPSEQTDFYSEMWVQYPPSEGLVPLQMDHKMYLEAQLYIILGETGGSPPVEELSLVNAFHLKNKLDHWFARVCELFDPKRLVFPSHYHIHMQYYYWIIRMFRPLADSPATGIPLHASMDETPEEIVRYSQAMLETLLRLYYLRHSYEMHDAWIIHFLMVLGADALKQLHAAPATSQSPPAEVVRSSLLLAVKGLKDQGENVYIARLCSLGLQKSMEPKDLEWVQTYLSIKSVSEKEQLMIDEIARCSYPVPIVRADGELETQKLGHVMKGDEETEQFSDGDD